MNNYLKTLLLSFGVVLGAATALLGFSTSVSAAVDNTPDCDNVAIIRCGAFTASEMRNKASKGDVPRVFNALGISQNELKGKYVDGIVWQDGRVTVDGKVVATGAMTAGRNNGGTPIPNTKNAGKYSTSKFVTEGQTAFVKMIDGKFSFAVVKACGNPVSAKPKSAKVVEQPKPAYECVSLTAEKLSRTKYKFTIKAAATGGATIETYVYHFGDTYEVTYTGTSYTYEYKQPGTYKADVVVYVKVNGKTQQITPGAACTKTITIPPVKTTPPAPMCPYDETLPKNSPDCVKPGQGATEEMCDIEGKENLPIDSEDCVEEEEVAEDLPEEVQGTTDEAPKEISKTGPEAVMAGIFGSGALSYGAYAYASSRRHLIDKFLGR